MPAPQPAGTTPLVLFGGTFDPVHRAHISAARAVSRVLGDAPVHLLPNAVPPHRPQPLADGEQRLAMLSLACAPYPALTADDWELRQSGPSYSLNTLRHFRDRIGQRPLVFLIGADSFASLHQWHHWRDYTGLCHLAVVPRPDCPLARDEVQAAFPEASADALRQQPAGLRLMLQRPFLDVSATAIRDALARKGQCPALDDAVIAHIHRHHLYNVAHSPSEPDSDNEAP
ncbi:nicotinate-nucleotide adenylyltransferase [Alcanivorax hongdengensis A-11-3]|uniref:Probable nicotinate-nucleotide adenylyltransferase n=1 Tax=Alcanivorax hongdengensis A-11-3 TaxID=1177179 RepID=L0WGD3_9GAMM|nr:nicotinate-nucleotide adenylyltransferase [Alcanivorax hongdengensis]EKF75784.1 nicotinate-nucleotide adenylyltransferase [Alcanivorax hongdengensis A-11-3]